MRENSQGALWAVEHINATAQSTYNNKQILDVIWPAILVWLSHNKPVDVIARAPMGLSEAIIPNPRPLSHL